MGKRSSGGVQLAAMGRDESAFLALDQAALNSTQVKFPRHVDTELAL
jgi:hypothetical protein